MGAMVSNMTYRPLNTKVGYCRQLLISDLVGLAEAFDVLEEVRNEAALRALGQELMIRKKEISADDSRRVRAAFARCDLPLSKVWQTEGARNQRLYGETITRQTFAPKRGHEKKQERKDQEVSRASPPRKMLCRETSNALFKQGPDEFWSA